MPGFQTIPRAISLLLFLKQTQCVRTDLSLYMCLLSYILLRWVFDVVRGLSLAVVSRDYSLVVCGLLTEAASLVLGPGLLSTG